VTGADHGPSGSDRGGRAPVEVWMARLDVDARSRAGERPPGRSSVGDTPEGIAWPREPGSLLTPDEHDRAERFRFAEDRNRWARARATTREILSARTGVPARDVAWREGPRGKPELGGSARLHFNLSHSGPLLAVALSTAGPVGVDVEVVEPLRDMERVAARVFSEEEWRPAGALGDAARLRYFYRLWTLKEAVLKYLGTGLSLSPTAVALHPTAEDPPFVRSVEAAGWPADGASGWSFDPGPTLAGASEDTRASVPKVQAPARDAPAPGRDAPPPLPDAIGAVVWSGARGEPVFRSWPPP